MVKKIVKESVNDLVVNEEKIFYSLNNLLISEDKLGCVDGQIIGTGRPDYTQDSTEYDLVIDDNNFLLIDIPGIEGDERKYVEIIKKSLMKAHVIFYVNGSGKKIEKDSLEKIKKYMRNDTSVYAIFNVHCKVKANRIAGIDKPYSEELAAAYTHQKEIVRQTEAELKSFLGDNFKGSVSLNGLLSFCSLAMDSFRNTTIANGENKSLRNDQIKLLKEYSQNSSRMVEESNINDVQAIIVDKINGFQEYIEIANLKKLKNRLEQIILAVDALRSAENNKIQEFYKIYDQFENKCGMAVEDFNQAIKQIGRSIVEDAFLPLQDELFDAVENNNGKINQYDTEYIFGKHKDRIVEQINSSLDSKITNAINEYKESVSDAEKHLNKDLQREQIKFESVMRNRESGFDTSFISELKFSGKDFGRSIFSIGGYVLSGFQIGSVVPALGNIVGAVIGFFVGLGMTIVNWFSSKQTRINRAKEKIKDTIDGQIDSVTKDLLEEIQKADFEGRISQNYKEIQNSIAKQKKSFEKIDLMFNILIEKLNRKLNDLTYELNRKEN